jgi:hypothetical protein
MTASTAPHTYRLGSTPNIYTPSIVQMAVESLPRKQAIKLLSDGYGLPVSAAAFLIDGGDYTIDGETVVFTA